MILELLLAGIIASDVCTESMNDLYDEMDELKDEIEDLKDELDLVKFKNLQIEDAEDLY